MTCFHEISVMEPLIHFDFSDFTQYFGDVNGFRGIQE